MKQKLTVLFALITILSGFSAKAEEDHKDHHTSHKAHVHGTVELTLALEGNTLEIRMESPAANLVGFEHKATTQKEKAAIKKAEAVLLSPRELFSFNGSDCELKKATADVSGVMGDHEHHEHEEHHQEHGEKGGHDETHSDILADYHFSCNSPGNLTSVTVALFDPFPGIEQINAIWVTETGQGADKLGIDQRAIRLR